MGFDILEICKQPHFVIAAGLGAGFAFGCGIMITYLARWGRKLFNGAESAEEPKAPYNPRCSAHDSLTTRIDLQTSRLDVLQEGQERIERKVDQILLSYIPRVDLPRQG